MRSSGRLAVFWLILALVVAGGVVGLSVLNRRPPQIETTRLELLPVAQTLVLRGRLQRVMEVNVHPTVSGWVVGTVPRIGQRVDKGERLLRLRADPLFVAQVDEALALRREARQEIRRLSRVAVRSPVAGTLTGWEVEPGAAVEQGQTLAVVTRQPSPSQTPEQHPVASPVAGQTLPFLVSPGDEVTPQDDLPLLMLVPADEPDGAEWPGPASDAVGRLLRADADLKRLALAAARPFPSSKLPPERAFVEAPLAGEVTWRALSLVPGRPVDPDQRVLALASSERILLATLHEVDYPNVFVGQPVSATFDAFLGRSFDASLVSKSRTPAESIFDQFSEYSAVFSLSDPAPELVDGMSCNLVVEVASRPDARSLPISAIVRDQGPPSVWVGDAEGQWELAPVELGLAGDMRVEVLGGLDPADDVALWPEMLRRTR